MSDATVLLAAMEEGEPGAPEQLLEVVYDELRRLAAGKMARERPGQTLQATALVHEAWLRLVGNSDQRFENKAHFFSAAAEAMRRILIERARRKLARRHGGGYERIDLEEDDIIDPEADQSFLAVHQVVDALARDFPVQAEVVKLRFFVGMTNEEIAKALDLSVGTVKNYWTFARAWIYNEIKNPVQGQTS
jgi:RNA polymerase sigma factor (TIGR02999 family)